MYVENVEKIAQLIGRVKRERGRVAEPLADRAADLLVAKGEIISDWWRASNRQDRMLGIDRFALRIADGEPIPIQIKSTEVGRNIAQKEHPGIPVLLVIVGEPLEEICRKIIQVVQNAI